ncbi:MAG: Arc family DNA-binding protein [Thiothrix sp.]|nr:Arc family DNA-binding protein [Thiothrix sp.]HPQ96168.1 Arc family DNA-binding protein [Thiolinea sp.]
MGQIERHGDTARNTTSDKNFRTIGEGKFTDELRTGPRLELRLAPELRERLEEIAKQNGRSLNSEIALRLQSAHPAFLSPNGQKTGQNVVPVRSQDGCQQCLARQISRTARQKLQPMAGCHLPADNGADFGHRAGIRNISVSHWGGRSEFAYFLGIY